MRKERFFTLANPEYVQEWFDKGSHDLTAAELVFKAGGPADTVAVLLQQAVEKYIKGFLISRGWRLKRTHDLGKLLEAATEHDPGFKGFVKLGNRLTELYIAERYPSVPSLYPSNEIASLMDETKKLVDLIKESTK
ncbi:MAG: HEPN domain-containing protein [Chloroflexi bacterium]|nr:HEPN domain-containing protein [Chloroflexota bacterium]